MFGVAYRIVVRKEKIQGIHFLFPFFIAQGENNVETRSFIARSLALSFIILLAMFKIGQLKQW